MLRAALSLRYLMLVASLGAVAGALLMFFEAVTKLAGGFRAVVYPDGSNGKSVMSAVMGATDASLFGIVLYFSPMRSRSASPSSWTQRVASGCRDGCGLRA